MDQLRTFANQYRGRRAALSEGWSAAGGDALKAFCDLYRAAGDPGDLQWVLDGLARRVREDGTMPELRTDGDLPAALHCGKALFFALDETGDGRYRIAADALHAEARRGGSIVCRPDALYMALPFLAEYDRRFLAGLETADIARQFIGARAALFDEDRRLYRGASGFPAQATGWVLMALADCVGQMSEQLYEHRRVLMDQFLEAVRGALPYADEATGLFRQTLDRPDAPLDAPASAMIATALLKGVRLGLLNPERDLTPGLKAFGSLLRRGFAPDADGGAAFLMAWSEVRAAELPIGG